MAHRVCLVTLLLGVLFWLGSIQAQPPAQQTTRALDSQSFTHGLLWKIEAPPSQKPSLQPSYLFGTIHAEDPRITHLPLEVQRALASSRSFCMELIPDAATTQTLVRGMLYTDGRTLPKIVGRKLFAQLVPLMQPRGVSAEALSKFKPWAVYMTLSLPQAKTGKFLDLLLYEQALHYGQPICGIETAKEQLAVFEQTPLAEQIVLLQELVRDPQAAERQLQQMIPLYVQRNIAELLRVSTDVTGASIEERRNTEAFLTRLIDKRNKCMIARLLPRLHEGGVFIAVGALHLPGPQGLLRLLANRGYVLTPVY